MPENPITSTIIYFCSAATELIERQATCYVLTYITVMAGRADGSGEQAATSTAVEYRHGAKALIASADAVLLVKEYHDDGTGFWTLPGGGVRPDETLTEGLHRELSEELGCDDPVIGDRVGRLWYAHRSRSDLVSRYAVFECRTLSRPMANEAEGVAAVKWVRPGMIPRKTLLQVRAICRALHDPELMRELSLHIE